MSYTYHSVSPFFYAQTTRRYPYHNRSCLGFFYFDREFPVIDCVCVSEEATKKQRGKRGNEKQVWANIAEDTAGNTGTGFYLYQSGNTR